MAGRTVDRGKKNGLGLTDQQLSFCRFYAQTLNAGEAYEKAGYKVTNKSSRDAAGSRLLGTVKVRDYLREVLNLDEVFTLNAVVACALTPITEVLQWDGRELIVKQTDQWSDRAKLAVKKIKVKSKRKVIESRDSRAEENDAPIPPLESIIESEIEVEMYDRLSALDKLMRKLKLYPRDLQTIECVAHLASKGLLLPEQAEAIINGLDEFEERLRSLSGHETDTIERRGISEETFGRIRSQIMGIDAESLPELSEPVLDGTESSQD